MMRVLKLIVALIAFVVAAKSARADLVFLLLDSPTQVINDFVPFGNQPYLLDDGINPPSIVPAVSPLNNPFAEPGSSQAGSITLQAGQKRIIQVALLDTLIGNVFPPIPGGDPNGNPASSIPPQGIYTNPRWLSTANGTANIPQMFGLQWWSARFTGTVVGSPINPIGGAFVAGPRPNPLVDPPYGNSHLSLVHPGARFQSAGAPPVAVDFAGFFLTGQGAIPNRNYISGINQPELGGRFALFNFEITTVASDPGGVYPITLSDSAFVYGNQVQSTGAGGIGLPGDAIELDSVIFSAVHPNYVLNVTVIPIPEPSSIALVGMMLAGLGYRSWRRGTWRFPLAMPDMIMQ